MESIKKNKPTIFIKRPSCRFKTGIRSLMGLAERTLPPFSDGVRGEFSSLKLFDLN